MAQVLEVKIPSLERLSSLPVLPLVSTTRSWQESAPNADDDNKTPTL